MSVERIVTEVLRQSGGVQVAIAHGADSSRHLDDLVLEVLEGDVDDTNRTFLASRLSRTDQLCLLVFRRQVLQEGDGFTHANQGRAFLMDAAPSATDGSVDLPPIALYFASTDPVVELTATTMDAIPPRRRRVIEEEIPPRRKRVMPV